MFRLSAHRQPSLTFTGKANDCTGGTERCWHPAPYEVRDNRHRVQRFCIKHLEEWRRAA